MANSDLHIRPARASDAEKLLAIYAPYVRETAITFELTVPTVGEFAGRIRDTLAAYPYWVAELGGAAVGYAYASRFRARAAYDWVAETSVYVDRACRGAGVGTALYAALERSLARMNVVALYACITTPNPTSIRFHEKLGYRPVGLFPQCGYKLGQWHDVAWLAKDIAPRADCPRPIIPFSRL
ncbi:MAG: N-acetyltransferase [Clostridiales bacterium]|nr:N-acetyltransferase [Clostridiales bacterium]